MPLAWQGCQPGGLDRHTQRVAPGVWLHKVHLVGGPWRVNVLEVDLPQAAAAGYRLQVAQAAGCRPARTTELAEEALAAVNGDFFSEEDGHLVARGFHVRNGRVLRPPVGRSALAVDSQGRPLIARFRLEAEVLDARGVSYAIGRMGRRPRAAELSLYSAYSCVAGDSLRAELGFDLDPLVPAFGVNDTVPVCVRQLRLRWWPLPLVAGHWLLAAGQSHPAGRRIGVGDTLQVHVRVEPEDEAVPPDAAFEEAIGGGPRLLRDGEVAVEYAPEKLSQTFAQERHPRTAVGYSRDGRVLYMVVVDGRQPGYSVGMSLEELATFMRARLGRLGRSGAAAYQALNLDGGGSTTMVVNRQVVNSPSDQTGERAVANALVLVGARAGR